MSTAQLIDPFVNQLVIVSTHDGKILVGKLIGCDPQCNLVLAHCKERIFQSDQGAETHEHGLYLVRGDNVATLGDVDEEIDSSIVWSEVQADPLKHIRF
jgi:U6 snRNA-associated Sm-like protein LSm8